MDEAAALAPVEGDREEANEGFVVAALFREEVEGVRERLGLVQSVATSKVPLLGCGFGSCVCKLLLGPGQSIGGGSAALQDRVLFDSIPARSRRAHALGERPAVWGE